MTDPLVLPQPTPTSVSFTVAEAGAVKFVHLTIMTITGATVVYWSPEEARRVAVALTTMAKQAESRIVTVRQGLPSTNGKHPEGPGCPPGS